MAVAAGTDGFVTTIGVLLLFTMLVVPPGVLVGLLLGLAVLAVARRLPPRGAPARPRKLALAVAAVFGLSIVASAAVLRFTASDGIGWQAYTATSAVLAVIPTTLASIAWRRWPPLPTASLSGRDDGGNRVPS